MYSLKKLMKTFFLSVFFFFSKFSDSSQIYHDIPYGSTQSYFHPYGKFHSNENLQHMHDKVQLY
jgi:hypothetical protein